MATRMALSVALAATFLFSGQSAARAYTTTGCAWDSFTIYIDYRYVNGNFRTAFQQAASNYRNSTHVKVYPSDQSGNAYTAQNSNYGATGWEGYSNWSCLFGTTHSANSRLNQYYLSGSESVTRLKVVWLHELGHGLGLGHVSVLQRVMYPSASQAYFAGVTALTSDELNGIYNIYG